MKVVQIVANINKSLGFEWVATHIDRQRFDLEFILLNPGNSELENFLKRQGIAVTRIRLCNKWDLILSIMSVWWILMCRRPRIVHTHLLAANLSGLTAAFLAGIKCRVYTRHHATFNYKYQPHGIKYDAYSNRLSTQIVAISENVRNILTHLEKVDPQKITVIRHGFALDQFENISKERVDALYAKYKLGGKHPVIGVIARYIHWKGIQFIIPAFQKIRSLYPGAILVLANASGPDSSLVHAALSQLDSESYIEIPFENDLFALYKLFDLYVHTPIDGQLEAYGQTYVEALAAGIPSVFTLSGVAPEFIVNRQNALVVAYQNSEAIYAAMKELLTNKQLAMQLANAGRESVRQFSVKRYINELEKLYTTCANK